MSSDLPVSAPPTSPTLALKLAVEAAHVLQAGVEQPRQDKPFPLPPPESQQSATSNGRPLVAVPLQPPPSLLAHTNGVAVNGSPAPAPLPAPVATRPLSFTSPSSSFLAAHLSARTASAPSILPPSMPPSALILRQQFPFHPSFSQLVHPFPSPTVVTHGGEHFYQPGNLGPTPQPSPLSPFLSSYPKPPPGPHTGPPSTDPLVLPFVREVEGSINLIRPSNGARQRFAEQLDVLLNRDATGKYLGQGGGGGKQHESAAGGQGGEVRERLVESLKELNEQVLRRVQWIALHPESEYGYEGNGGEREARRKEKAKRRRKEKEGGNTGAEKGERKVKRKRKREEEGEEERRMRKKDKKRQRKSRLKAKERKRQRDTAEGQNGGEEQATAQDGKAKKRKRSSGGGVSSPDGHPHSQATTSSSSSSASSDDDDDDDEEDHLPLFPKPHSKTPHAASDTNGHAEQREIAHTAVVMVTPASIVPEQARKERKERKEKKRSGKAKEAEARTSHTPALLPPPPPPTSGLSSLMVDDFAPAFERLRGSFADVGRQPAIGRPGGRRRVHPPPLPDDAAGVVERSVQLSTLVFHQADIMALMKPAMPLDTAISLDAAALVTQAVCHFIALITAEAEDGVHPFPDDEDGDEPQPLRKVDTSVTSADSLPASTVMISSEKVLDALLRLGFEDYAILSARHIQRHREAQLQQTAAASSEAAMDVRATPSTTAVSSSSSSSALTAASTQRRHRAWLPATLSGSYLLSNAQYIDLDKFSPSVPRHPITDGFKPHLPPTILTPSPLSPSPKATPSSSAHHSPSNPSTKKRRPSTKKRSKPSSSSPPSSTPSSAPTSALSSPSASRELAYGGGLDAAALERKKAAATAAWKRRRELMAAGVEYEDITRIMKEERKERDAAKRLKERAERQAAATPRGGKAEKRRGKGSSESEAQAMQQQQQQQPAAEGDGAREEVRAAPSSPSAVAMESDAPSASAGQEVALSQSEGG